MAKWYFKHSNSAMQGPSLSNLMYNKHYKEVCLYWIILEMISRNGDEANGTLQTSRQHLAYALRTRSRYIATMLQTLSEHIEGFTYELKGSNTTATIELTISNYAELQESKNQKPIYKKRKDKNRIDNKKRIEKKEEKQKIPEFEITNFESVLEIIPEQTLKKWSDLYPDHVWMKSEIEDALLWNKEKGMLRTQTGWILFLGNWLKRATPRTQPKQQPKTFAQIQSERNTQAIVDAFGEDLFDEAK